MAFVRKSDIQLEDGGVAVASAKGVRGNEALRVNLEVLGAGRAAVQVPCARYRCGFQLWGLYVGYDD
jgi:hypothetical protein